MIAQPQDPARLLEEVERGVLHVLAGAQAGAQISLRDGIYLVGSGDGCDVVLVDDSVAGTHLAISVGQERIDIEAREGAISLVDQTLQPGESATIAGAAALALGGTSLAIGAADTDWSALTVPPPQRSDTPAAEDAAEEATESTSEPAEAKATDDAEPAAAPDETTPRRRRGWLLVLLVVAIAAVALLAWRFVAPPPAAVEAPAAPVDVGVTQTEKAITVATKLNLSEVRVVADDTGTTALRGFVADDAERTALRAALDDAGIGYVDRLRVASELIAQVRLTLASYGWTMVDFGQHLEVGYAGFGAVFVDGYLGPTVDRTVLRRHILGDVPGVRQLEFRRADTAAWKAVLDARLAQAGLSRWLTTRVAHGEIEVSGELTELEARVWREVGEAFVTQSRGWPKLHIKVRLARRPTLAKPTIEPDLTPAAAAIMAPIAATAPAPAVASPADVSPAAAPDITVVGIITSATGFKRVLLSDGATLAEGDTVEDKFTVAEIHADRVVLSTRDRTFTYHVKEAK